MIYLFPDTNIFLHYKHPIELNWRSLAGGDDVTLVVTMQTLSELDKHKNVGTTKALRERARSRVKWLGDVQDGKLTSPLAVEFGDRVPNQVFFDHGLDKDHPDDRHIAGMLAHGDGEAVRQIITADIGMKTRVRSRKLLCASPDDSDRLPDEDDPEVVLLRKEKADLLRQVHRCPDLKLTFEDGTKVLRYPIKLPAEVTERHLQEELLEYERKKIAPIRSFEVVNVTTGEPLRVEGNSRRIEEYLNDYKKYLEDDYAYRLYELLCVPVCLVLRNDGTLPASTITVDFALPEGVKLVSESKPPPKPERPEWDPLGTTALNQKLLGMVIPRKFLTSFDRGVVPKFEGYFDERQTWQVRNIRHTDDEKENLFVIFDSPARVQNLAIKALVKSAETIEPVEVSLGLVVRADG